MQLINDSPRSIYAEAFRTIKTNIKYSSVDKNKKIFIITSDGAGEGKSNTAINLAMSLADDGKKILLVDCALRNPTIDKVFNLKNTLGLTDILIGEKSLERTVIKQQENMHILLTGHIPPNPAELLASERMEFILGEMKVAYDYIIIDTPPLRVVSDSRILASICDGVILVARYEKTKKEKLVECKKIIEQVGGNLIGIVINRVKGREKGI